MRTKGLERVAALCICAFLLLGQSLPLALAYGETEDAFTIRITPPASASGESAPVEILVTDNAGDGFKRVQVRKGKSETWQIITSDMERRENRYYGSTMITENCTVYVRVTSNSGKFYENSKYIECFGVPYTEQPVSTSTDNAPDTARPLTPEGTASVLDNATDADGKEFFTFTTPAENVFYLVIDKQRQDKNVYFLNAVTEKDLMALAETEDAASGTSGGASTAPVTPEPQKQTECICTDKCIPGEVNADCPVCVLSYRNCKGEAHDHDSGDNVSKTQARNNTSAGTLAVMLLVVLGVGGAGYYFKIYKPKKELEDAEDLDDLTGGDEEEPTVNEDEQEPSGESYVDGNGGPDYDDYPGYPDGYGDEPEYPEEGV